MTSTPPPEAPTQASEESAESDLLPPLDVNDDELRRGIAAVLFISDEPLTVDVLAQTLGIAQARISRAITELVEVFTTAETGFDLQEVAGGWRLMTSPDSRTVLERWLVGARHGRLTQAALETLAVVAYRQPIARVTIGEIRGVNPDGALRSLIARGLVAEAGREEGPGQAVLFGTTTQFLERMGLRSLAELPPVPPYLPDGPAPDEPEAGAIADLRRRLRDGSERLGGGTGRTGAQQRLLVDAGSMVDSDDDDDALMAPPAARRPEEDGAIGALSERLEAAARSAMGRLRSLRTEPQEAPERERAEPSPGAVAEDTPSSESADG